MADSPCRNESCKSYGQIHPNCRCYSDGYAEGGLVSSCCSEQKPHLKTCPYYAEGGAVSQTPLIPHSSDPARALAYAAVEHGLLGLYKRVGKPNMMNPDQHLSLLEDMKNQHEWRREPKDLPLPKTVGTRLGDHLMDQNHEKAADHLHGHALVGSIAKSHLKEALPQLSGALMTAEPDPVAFRSAVEYLSSAKRGEEKLNRLMKNLLGDEKAPKWEPEENLEKLKELLKESEAEPEMLLEIGGSLAHYLPDASTQLAATVGGAIAYLKGIEPKANQRAPLDPVFPVNPVFEQKFNRQLAIADQPLLILDHFRKGDLISEDLNTVKNIYPTLFQILTEKVTEELLDVMAKEKEISYVKKQNLSKLLGQPLDSSLLPDSLQTIVKANSLADQSQTQPKGGAPSKASAVELKQIDKMAKIYGTDSQDKELDGKRA